MDTLKILHSTDWHMTAKNPSSRTDVYPLTCLKKLHELGLMVLQTNPDIITIGGDIFHTPKISLKFAGLIAEIMRSWAKPIYVVPGSHDMFGRDIANIDQTMLGYMEKTGVIKILTRGLNETFTIGNSVVNIEGQEYYNEIDTGIKDDYGIRFPKDYNILIVHSTLVAKPFVEQVAYTLIKDVKTDANLVLAGHYHPGWPEVTTNGTTFSNAGSLLRDSIEKRDQVYATFIELKEVNGKIEKQIDYIPLKCAKPAKEVLDLQGNESKKENNNFINQYKKMLVDTGKIKDTHSIMDMINDVLTKSNASSELRALCIEVMAKAEEKVIDKQDYYNGYIEKPYKVWIKEVELINFRTHEHTIVKFTEGTNVIVGEGSNGNNNIQFLKIAV